VIKKIDALIPDAFLALTILVVAAMWIWYWLTLADPEMTELGTDWDEMRFEWDDGQDGFLETVDWR
jgi:hypothetical protein